jgi:hypothetical protein
MHEEENLLRVECPVTTSELEITHTNTNKLQESKRELEVAGGGGGVRGHQWNSSTHSSALTNQFKM